MKRNMVALVQCTVGKARTICQNTCLLKFMEKNVLNKNKCYLPETIPLCEEMNKYTNDFFKDITKGIM